MGAFTVGTNTATEGNGATLTFQDIGLEVSGTGAKVIIQKYSVANFENVAMTVKDANIAVMGFANSTINIKSGIYGASEGTTFQFMGTCNIMPTAAITVKGKFAVSKKANIIPQNGYTIKSATTGSTTDSNLTDITSDIGKADGAYELTYVSPLEIQVENCLENAANPVISEQTTGIQTYEQNAKCNPLSVTATSPDGGTLSYQWYTNTTNSTMGGKKISGETSSSYTPDSSVVGNTFFYYCLITNTKEGMNPASIWSNFMYVMITEPSTGYSVSLSNFPETSVLIGQSFTADIIMKSTGSLSAAELTLNVNKDVIKITNVKIAESLTATGKNNINEEGSSAKISFYGNTNSAADGLTVATVTFEAVTAGSGNIAIANDAIAAASGEKSDITVAVPETATVIDVVSESYSISDSSYAGGKYLIKYSPANEITTGCATYDGKDMYWSDKYDSWVYLADSKVSLDKSNFNVNAQGSKIKIDYSGDLNVNNKINIVDAQIAYDIATGTYKDFEVIDLLSWLMADVNSDGEVDAGDARAIQYYIHYGTFE